MSGATLVIGGGWAGLAAAAELALMGHSVTLLEAAPQLGGRARAAPFDGLTVDNGQHLLIGAYRETLRLLSALGAQEEELFLRCPLALEVRGTHPTLRLAAAALPAPLHLLWGIATARGFGPGGRRATVRAMRRWGAAGFRPTRDISVIDLLAEARQPAALAERLWGPLCLAALNTPPEHASAAVFLRVLHDAFAAGRADADLLHPRRDLGALFAEPVRRAVEAAGGRIRTRTRVSALELAGGGVTGVRCNGERLAAKAVILAAAPRAAARLCAPHAALAPLADTLGGLEELPIATVYLRYPPAVTLEREMVGFSDGTVQWLIDRGAVCGQAGVMAAVVSGPGPHAALDGETLAAQVAAELARRFPHWPAPLAQRAIRERRATFACHVGIAARRPAPGSALPGLWLAGDYTDTGYPATLEGAVRSGVQCARLVSRSL